MAGKTLRLSDLDLNFKFEVAKTEEGRTMLGCIQCGICTATCPVARFIDVYRPNKIINLAKLGIMNDVYGNSVWLCATCNLCTKRCPHRVKVHDVMYALKNLVVKEGYGSDLSKEITIPSMISKFKETLATLEEEVPLPVAYSWLCLGPFKKESKRSRFGKLILDILQHSLEASKKEVTPLPKPRGEKIAIIGSGPAGLTAAWELVRRGFPVTVFESLPKPGGMLRVGIPDDRLPKDILDVEIRRIEDLGVDIRTNTTVDKDLFNHILKGEEYKAVFIAIGAHKSRKLGVEGEDLKGVIHALDFLLQVNLQRRARLGKRVVVVGGGGVAMDAARTALRFGAEVVQLACLESREEMPAHGWEIRELLTEGVVLNVSWGPKRILGDGKKVTGVEFTRCLKVFDENGRFNPSFDETSTKVLEADTVILAIGQTPDLSFLGTEINVLRGIIVADPTTMETNFPGVFAGGDAMSGPASWVEAIVAGKIAAASIDHYLSDIISHQNR